MPPHKQFRKFTFDGLGRLLLDGKEYSWESSDEFGHSLFLTTTIGMPVLEGFSHEEIDRLVTADRLSYEPHYYDEQKVRLRIKSGGVTALFELPEDEQAQVVRRMEYCDLLLQVEAGAGSGFARTDAKIAEALVGIHNQIRNRNEARAADGKISRCDQEFSSKKCPSTRTMRRWLAEYEDGGLDPIGLRSGHCRSGNPMSSLDPRAASAVIQVAEQYADTRKPTVVVLHGRLREAIDKINEGVAKESALPYPSIATLRAAVKRLPAFHVEAGRNGIAAAKRKYTIVGRGPDVVRAGQRLEGDGHKMQLFTRVPNWREMSSQQFIREGTERLIVIATIDAASRACTGLRISRTENKEAAIAALQMSVMDKTEFARAYGCKSDWPMAARWGSINTDTGSAWIAEPTRTVIANMKCRVENAAVGVPNMRGTQERFFGTIQRTFVVNFSGQSFENVVAKGDYSGQAQSSIDSDDMPGELVRFIVDKYHHSPHAGLLNETPYDAWHRLVDMYGITPPPGRDERRNIFGPTTQRALDHRGVRLAGVHYQSPALQEFRRNVGDTKVGVKFDEFDLGRVSVWVNGAWLTVRAVGDKLDGVHLDTWSTALRDLRRRNMVKSQLSWQIAEQAMRDIASTSERAIARANVDKPMLTADALIGVERSLLQGFDMFEDHDLGPVTANRDEQGRRTIFGNPTPIAEVPSATATPQDDAPAPADLPTDSTIPVRTRAKTIDLED